MKICFVCKDTQKFREFCKFCLILRFFCTFLCIPRAHLYSARALYLMRDVCFLQFLSVILHVINKCLFFLTYFLWDIVINY